MALQVWRRCWSVFSPLQMTLTLLGADAESIDIQLGGCWGCTLLRTLKKIIKKGTKKKPIPISGIINIRGKGGGVGGGCWKMIHTCCAGTWASLFMIGGKQHYHWPFRENTALKRALLHVSVGDHVKTQQKVNKVVFYSTCDTTTARQRRVWLQPAQTPFWGEGVGWEVEGSPSKPWCRQKWMVFC